MEMVGGVFVEMVGVVCRCLWRWWESVCGDGWCRVWFLVEMVGVVFVGMVGVVCRFLVEMVDVVFVEVVGVV